MVEYESVLDSGDTDDSDKGEKEPFVTSSSNQPSATKRPRASDNDDRETNEVREPSSRSSQKWKLDGQSKRSEIAFAYVV